MKLKEKKNLLSVLFNTSNRRLDALIMIQKFLRTVYTNNVEFQEVIVSTVHFVSSLSLTSHKNIINIII